MLISLLLSCLVRTSSIHGLEEGGDAAAGAVPRAQADCQWVVVEETKTTKLMALTLGTSSRQYDQALFYCCPGEAGHEPACRSTDWHPKPMEPPRAEPSPQPAVSTRPLTAPELTTTMVYALLGRPVNTFSDAWATDLSFVSRAMADGHTQEEILTATQLGMQKVGTGRDVPTVITAGLAVR